MWQPKDTNCIYAALAREKYHYQAMIKFVFPARVMQYPLYLTNVICAVDLFSM